MSRNTHRRDIDHHGTDLASHIELGAATTNYAIGDDLQTVVADLDTRAGTGGGGGDVATDVIFNVKGDLPVGTGSDTAARLAAGANDTILMADSAQTTGLKWVASQTPSTQAFSDAAAQGTADTYARGDHKHGMPASPAGGSVATDVIFDVKGDLAVGTGSNTAARLAPGTDGYELKSRAAATLGIEWAPDYAGIEAVIDGGGAAITPGVKGNFRVPFDCIIERVSLLADQTGSIVVDIWVDTYANYPPVVGDTITASAKPTLSTANKMSDTTLTGWLKTLAEGSIIRYNVDSASTVTQVTVELKVRKT